jgi:hypothetical protein
MGMSAAWMAGAMIAVTFADVRIAQLLRYAAFEVCDYVNHHLCHCGNCWRELMDVASFVDQPAINLLLIVLAPIVVAWSAAWAAVGLYRVAGSSNG